MTLNEAYAVKGDIRRTLPVVFMNGARPPSHWSIPSLNEALLGLSYRPAYCLFMHHAQRVTEVYMAVKQLVTEPPPEGRPMGLDGPVVLLGVAAVAAAGPAAEQELPVAAGGGGMPPADQGQGQQRLQLLPDYLLFMALMQQVRRVHTECCVIHLGARGMRKPGGILPMALYSSAPSITSVSRSGACVSCPPRSGCLLRATRTPCGCTSADWRATSRSAYGWVLGACMGRDDHVGTKKAGVLEMVRAEQCGGQPWPPVVSGSGGAQQQACAADVVPDDPLAHSSGAE